MHEVVFTDKRQARKGVHTLDIAKRLIDYGFHPMTIYFPLIVSGAMLDQNHRKSVGRRGGSSSSKQYELPSFAAPSDVMNARLRADQLLRNVPRDPSRWARRTA